MNSRNSFIFLFAILLLVSQLVGEDSTLVSVAGADDAEIQQSLKRGEETLKQMATTPAKSAAPRTAEPTLSLDDFYSSSKEDDTNDDTLSKDGEGVPEVPTSAPTTVVTRGMIVDQVNGVPILPQIP